MALSAAHIENGPDPEPMHQIPPKIGIKACSVAAMDISSQIRPLSVPHVERFYVDWMHDASVPPYGTLRMVGRSDHKRLRLQQIPRHLAYLKLPREAGFVPGVEQIAPGRH
jgi:hypothetical protein